MNRMPHLNLPLHLGLLAPFIFSALLLGSWSAASPALAGTQTTSPAPTPIPTDIQELEATPYPGVPVTLDGTVLFFVNRSLGSFTAEERAARISQRLEALASDPLAPPVELTLAESDQGINLMLGETALMTITAGDAREAGMELEEAAQYAAQVTEQAVLDYRQKNTPLQRLIRFLTGLGILIVLVALLVAINRGFKRLQQKWDERPPLEKSDDAVKTGFFRSRFWRRTVRVLITVGMVAADLAIVFVLTPFLLSLIPFTARYAQQILSIFTGPLSTAWTWFFENRSDFFTIFMVCLAAYGLSRLVKAFFAEVAGGGIRLGGFEPEWAPFTSKIINFLLLVGAIIVIFPYIPGSDSEAFRGITIFLGALFTLSSTAAVTNIVAGVIQTYTGAFRVGDVVQISGVTGFVIEKRLLTTRVRTFKQEDVSLPNSVVMSTNVTNYSYLARTTGLVLYTTITIGYDVPWRQVHALLLSAAAKTPDILSDPPPFILQTSLNDYHISYELNCFTRRPEIMPLLYSNLHQNIQDAFNQAGVEIMSPAFSALRDGNTVTIPEQNRPAGYQTPGFRVETAPASQVAPVPDPTLHKE